jgi:hypothetical protein
LLTKDGGTTEYVMSLHQALDFAAAIITARSAATVCCDNQEPEKPKEKPPVNFTVVDKFIRKNWEDHGLRTLAQGTSGRWAWSLELDEKELRMGLSLTTQGQPGVMLFMTRAGARYLAKHVAGYVEGRSPDALSIHLTDDIVFRLMKAGWGVRQIKVALLVGSSERSRAIAQNVNMPIACLSLIASYLETFANADERHL